MDAQALGRVHGRARTGIRVEYETVRVHLKAAGIVLSRPQSTPSRVPTPSMPSKKGDRRDLQQCRRRGRLLLGRRVQPELDAHPQGDMEPEGSANNDPYARPEPKKRYGIGALNYHTGQTVVLIRRRKRRREIAELLEALLQKSTRQEESTWPGTTPTPTRTTRSRGGLLRGAGLAGMVVL
jgi:hypothetical protein